MKKLSLLMRRLYLVLDGYIMQRHDRGFTWLLARVLKGGV